MTEQIEKHLTANGNMKRKDIMINNFLGGMAWGFGTVVGATVVVAFLIYVLKAVGIFETIGTFTDQMQALQELSQPTLR